MNILFISLDTLRADHLGCYGYFRDTSPNLDQLAREGARFNYCLSETAHTIPAYTSMMTGLAPITHGVLGTVWCLPNETTDLLDDATPTLAELLQTQGYLTCALDNMAGMAFHPKWFPRGFEFYINTWRHPRNYKMRASHVNARALPWLEQWASQEKFFLFLHYWDVHAAYEPPAPFNAFFPPTTADAPQPYRLPDGEECIPRWGRCKRLNAKALQSLAHYDCAIRYVDEELGRVLATLKRLGVYDDTLIVVNADHGEDMAEHQANFEHRECYDTTLRVPFLVKLPKALQAGANVGAAFDALITHADLAPTLLDFADGAALKIPPMDGLSLKPLLMGRTMETRETVCSTGYWVWDAGHWKSGEMSARTARWRYIERPDLTGVVPGLKEPIGFYRGAKGVPAYFALPKRELYDAQADPDEQVNLIAEKPDVAAEMRERLKPWLRSGWMAGKVME